MRRLTAILLATAFAVTPAIAQEEGGGGGVGQGAGIYQLFVQDAHAVPEPLTLSLFGAGLAGAAALRRRKKKMA